MHQCRAVRRATLQSRRTERERFARTTVVSRRFSGGSPVNAIDYLRRILSRNLHRPVAVVEGSLTSNLNKTWVRLWT